MGTHLMSTQLSLTELRQNYAKGVLDEHTVAADPLTQFAQWMQEALQSQLLEPNAMTLATVDAQGQPHARVMLLKEVSQGGFVFFTNYHSAKADDLTAYPRAALCFLWLELERQIRIEGRIEQVSREESERYFHSRPYASQLGAWASAQSQLAENRAQLETQFAAVEARYAPNPVPLPEHWGGYRLIPNGVEFWQGRPNRLHDRIRYRLHSDGTWLRERLQP